MTTAHFSWADDTLDSSLEETCPGDVLALSGEMVANDDDVWPVELFLEDEWDADARDPHFFVTGGPPVVLRMQCGRQLVTQAQGIVKRILEDRLILGVPGMTTNEIALGYKLPASVDLRPLIGRRVRVMLEEEAAPGGRAGQTLTVRTLDDHVWLVARIGAAHDVAHALGEGTVRVTLSPKHDGPLVVAAPGLQHIVSPSGEATMRIGASRYVVELVSRDGAAYGAYFIADARLWH